MPPHICDKSSRWRRRSPVCTRAIRPLMRHYYRDLYGRRCRWNKAKKRGEIGLLIEQLYRRSRAKRCSKNVEIKPFFKFRRTTVNLLAMPSVVRIHLPPPKPVNVGITAFAGLFYARIRNGRAQLSAVFTAHYEQNDVGKEPPALISTQAPPQP